MSRAAVARARADALSARTFQMHHRRRREGVLRVGQPHRRGHGREEREEAQLRERSADERSGTCRTACRAVRFRMARRLLPRKFARAEGVGSPDECNEEPCEARAQEAERPTRLLRRPGGVGCGCSYFELQVKF